MKVWVITTGSYSDYEIVTVFTDKVQADLFCAAYNDHSPYDKYYAEEYDTDTANVQVAEGVKPHYIATVSVNLRTGGIHDVYATPTLKPLSGFVKDYSGVMYEDYRAVFATDDEEVIKKIFYDWAAQKKAEEAGL